MSNAKVDPNLAVLPKIKEIVKKQGNFWSSYIDRANKSPKLAQAINAQVEFL